MSSSGVKKEHLFALICAEFLKRGHLYSILEQSDATITLLCTLGNIHSDTEEFEQLRAFAEREYKMELTPEDIDEVLTGGGEDGIPGESSDAEQPSESSTTELSTDTTKFH